MGNKSSKKKSNAKGKEKGQTSAIAEKQDTHNNDGVTEQHDGVTGTGVLRQDSVNYNKKSIAKRRKTPGEVVQGTSTEDLRSRIQAGCALLLCCYIFLSYFLFLSFFFLVSLRQFFFLLVIVFFSCSCSCSLPLSPLFHAPSQRTNQINSTNHSYIFHWLRICC